MTTDILNTEADLAADYIEGLLDAADISGDIELNTENNRANVSIVSEDKAELADLVGEEGEVLAALQELTRLSVNEQLQERTNLVVDINGWRKERIEELKKVATEAIKKLDSESEVHLEPMNSFERKNIHDLIAESGSFSRSEGTGKERHIVITKEEVEDVSRETSPESND